MKSDVDFTAYFAASGPSQIDLLKSQGVRDILVSFAHFKKGIPDAAKGCRLMLDSGAFSNIKNPGSIRLEEYMEFLQSEKAKVHEYVTFDVVHNPAATARNHEKLLKSGASPIFVDQLCGGGVKTDDYARRIYRSGAKVCWAGFVTPYGHRIKKDKIAPGTNPDVLCRCRDRYEHVRNKPATRLHLLGIGTRGRKFLEFWPQVESFDAASWMIRPSAFGQVLYLVTDKEGWPALNTTHHSSPHPKASVLARQHGWDLGHNIGRIKLALHEYKRFYRALEARVQKALSEHEHENLEKSTAAFAAVEIPDDIDTCFPSTNELSEKLIGSPALEDGGKLYPAGLSGSGIMPDEDIERHRVGKVLVAIEKRKSTAALLVEAGPPNEWSGGVAAVLGKEGQRRIKTLWEALDKDEQKKAQQAFEQMFEAEDVVLELEDAYGKLAKRIAVESVQLAVWTGAYINDLPDSAFLYIEPGGKKDEDGRTVPRSLRHFPVRGADGDVDPPHLRNALGRIPQSNIPQAAKDRATAEARRLLEELKEREEEQEKKDAEVQKPLPNEHAARQTDPAQYDRFARAHPEGFPDGLDVIYGIKDGKSEIQTVRARADQWTVAEFRTWLKEHGFKTAIEEAQTKRADPNMLEFLAAQLDHVGRSGLADSFEELYKRVTGGAVRSDEHAVKLDVPIIKVDEEKGIITGVVLEPETVDAQGDIVSKEVIERAAHSFLARYGRPGGSRLGDMHKSFGDIGWQLIECWIQRGDSKLGKGSVKDGSWLMSWKRTDDAKGRDAFARVKRGERTGFSIGGVASIP